MALDIFSDRRAGQDRRQVDLEPPTGDCRRVEDRSRRHANGVNSQWWLRTDYVESEFMIQRDDLRRSLSES